MWESGYWWFRVPTLRGVRVSASCSQKISRMVRQLSEHEGRKNGDERWSTWLRERVMGAGMSVGDGYSPVNSDGLFSITAGRGSWETGNSDQGRVGAGRELWGRGRSYRECNNPCIFM